MYQGEGEGHDGRQRALGRGVGRVEGGGKATFGQVVVEGAEREVVGRGRLAGAEQFQRGGGLWTRGRSEGNIAGVRRSRAEGDAVRFVWNQHLGPRRVRHLLGLDLCLSHARIHGQRAPRVTEATHCSGPQCEGLSREHH